MTNDRSLLLQSDVVLFHVGALVGFFHDVPLPDQRTPEQAWILYNLKPPTWAPLDMTRYNGLFNWTASYRLDSDVPVSYGGYIQYPPHDRYRQNLSVNFNYHKVLFSAWISSNCYDYNRRQVLIRQLKKLLGDDLSLYGTCGGKRCPQTSCFDMLSRYKFLFALENSNCRDYVTEKFWGALSRRQVPIVLGGASSEDYRKVAPPNSFIHIGDFPSLEQLVAHLRKVGADKALTTVTWPGLVTTTCTASCWRDADGGVTFVRRYTTAPHLPRCTPTCMAGSTMTSVLSGR
ncbi:hypothetical protein C0Q70_15806 [Pomacea canaliculata]|uniref:Fucosyltransferase n=1 Tax=Pomacea canaliculata TaxID=400727 RepID=A0A2T7NVX6_POMCA|nr:glycoprotein 3-alpha-L-fucosyltransferase A-like [Pomacea canaliculata]PVD25306.1 hypothetical protein C0Q70_15806 [Pomacea canaliculata]